MPVTNSPANVVGGSLPKWQLALAVGAPVALGLGYMYYKNSSQDKKTKDIDKKRSDKQLSIDDDLPEKSSKTSIEKTETPAEKALKFKTLGNEAYSAKKYDEAISFYNQAIEACPIENKDELAKNYQNRAAAYEALGKHSAVRDDCTKALEYNPKYAKAFLRRAKAYELENELELALEDATAACIVGHFQNTASLVVADRVLKQLGQQHADEYLKNKKITIPSTYHIKTYFRSFKNDPILSLDDEELLKEENKCLVRIFKLMKDELYDEVIDACTEEIEKYTDDNSQNKMKLMLHRATFYILVGDHKKALDDLEKVIDNYQISGDDVRVNALVKRALMRMQQEKRDECLKDFDTAVKINPNCSDIYHHRGQILLLFEKINEAKKDSDKAFELDPNNGVAYAQKCYVNYRFGAINRSSEMLANVIDDFEKGFELYPNCCECFSLYAQLLCDSQAFGKADEYFEKASKVDPTNATLYVHRGLLQLQWQANIEKGLEFINKAIEIDDKCEFAYETLGTVEVQRGNLLNAIKIFDKAIPLSRTNIELTHIFSLRDAARAQLKTSDKLGAKFMSDMRNSMS